MNLMVDIDNIEKFITSEKFTNFLVSNTTDIGTAGFILQVLFDKIEEIKNMEEEWWDNILIKDYIMDIKFNLWVFPDNLSILILI